LALGEPIEKTIDWPNPLHDRVRSGKARPVTEPLLQDRPRHTLPRRVVHYELLELFQHRLVCPQTGRPQSGVPEVLANDRVVGIWPFRHRLTPAGISSPTARNSAVASFR